MISALGRIGGTIIVWSTIVLLVVLTALLGSLAGIAKVLLALLLLPLLWDGAARDLAIASEVDICSRLFRAARVLRAGRSDSASGPKKVH